MVARLTEAATGGVLLRKCVLRNFAKFTGKHLRQILFFNKVANLLRLPPVDCFLTHWCKSFFVGIIATKFMLCEGIRTLVQVKSIQKQLFANVLQMTSTLLKYLFIFIKQDNFVLSFAIIRCR